MIWYSHILKTLAEQYNDIKCQYGMAMDKDIVAGIGIEMTLGAVITVSLST